MQYIVIATDRVPACSRRAALTSSADASVLFTRRIPQLAEYTSPGSFAKAVERRNGATNRASVRGPALIFSRADLGFTAVSNSNHFACEIGTPAGFLPFSFSAAFSALRAPTII